jgi:hypothetical protein
MLSFSPSAGPFLHLQRDVLASEPLIPESTRISVTSPTSHAFGRLAVPLVHHGFVVSELYII